MERDRTLSGAESTSGGGNAEDKDIVSDHESEEEKQSDSESEGETYIPWTSPRENKDSGRKRKNTSHISLSYRNSLSRQEKRIKPGEYKSIIRQ
jgi:SET domain-containing protein